MLKGHVLAALELDTIEQEKEMEKLHLQIKAMTKEELQKFIVEELTALVNRQVEGFDISTGLWWLMEIVDPEGPQF